MQISVQTITLAEIILEKLKHHALNQRSPARSGIENRWPKGKAKVKGRSPYKQHAQKTKQPTAARPEGPQTPYKQHALKGQKLLAQGNALGIKAISDAPCKGKSFKIHLIKL